METLEGIVERLENGEESLEGMTRLYNEGKKLINICKNKLDEAEKNLEDEDEIS